MFKFEMNQVVKDKVTGFQGIILARLEFATGCQHYGISVQSVTPGSKIPDWEYLDEARLELVTESKPLKKDTSPGQLPTKQW